MSKWGFIMNKKIVKVLLAAFLAVTVINARETVWFDLKINRYRHIPTGRIVSDNLANVAFRSYAKEKALFAAKKALSRSRFIKGVGAAIVTKAAMFGALLKEYYDHQLSPSDHQLLPSKVVDNAAAVDSAAAVDNAAVVDSVVAVDNAAVDVDGLCGSFEGNVNKLPEYVVDLPETVNKLPKYVVGLPEATVNKLPEYVADLPKAVIKNNNWNFSKFFSSVTIPTILKNNIAPIIGASTILATVVISYKIAQNNAKAVELAAQKLAEELAKKEAEEAKIETEEAKIEVEKLVRNVLPCKKITPYKKVTSYKKKMRRKRRK